MPNRNFVPTRARLRPLDMQPPYGARWTQSGRSDVFYLLLLLADEHTAHGAKQLLSLMDVNKVRGGAKLLTTIAFAIHAHQISSVLMLSQVNQTFRHSLCTYGARQWRQHNACNVDRRLDLPQTDLQSAGRCIDFLRNPYSY